MSSVMKSMNHMPVMAFAVPYRDQAHQIVSDLLGRATALADGGAFQVEATDYYKI
jgi:hypothetical protein